MKKVFVLACVAAVACCAEAVTWHVNQQRGDDVAAAADATGATPFLTIQAAVAKAAAGETVLVDPGTYTGPATTNATYGVSRVVITKAITLEATGSRDDTIIEGRWDTETDPDHGLGPNAIRCVYASSDVTIKGFTLLNGATYADDASSERPKSGGGFYGYTSASNAKLVDCAFVNCSSTRGGGMRYGYAIRTLFKNCYAGKYGAATREAGTSFCVFDGCVGPQVCAYISHVLQCTFVNNVTSGDTIHATAAKTVRNCLFVSGTATGSANITLEGCWFHTSSSGTATVGEGNHYTVTDGLVAPLFGDLRPVAGGVLAGAAADCSAYLLEGYRDLDFEGKPVDWSEGKVSPGALQETVAAAGGRIVFHNATARLFVDGVAVGGGDASSNYVYDVCWPTQHHVRAVASAASKDILRLDMTLNGANKTDKRPPPNKDNEVWITAPPPGNVCEYTPYETDVILWVDANAEYEGEADGSEAKPYRVLQEAVAVNAVGSGGGNRIIKVKKGVYDQGLGASMLYCASNRVEVCNGGFPRLVAVDGPEETFIVGAADEDALDTEDKGCGPAAVRCVAANQNCAFVGFTLTGGHSGKTSNNGSIVDAVQGGAVKSAANSDSGAGGVVLVDCIVTNNVAWRGSAGYGGRFLRCLIADNYAVRLDYAVSKGVAASCVFEKNLNSYGIMGGGYAYNCTFIARDSSSARAFGNVNLYNCVCYARKAGQYAPPETAGSVAWGYDFDDARILRTDPLFRDMAGGDYHLASVSPAVGLGDPEVYEWWIQAFEDFEGNRFRFVDGKVISGAFQKLAPAVVVGVSAGPESGVSTNGVVFLDEETGATVTATEAGTRLYDGFAINGEKVEGSAASASFTYNPATMPVPGETLTAVYLTNWYVNATTGDDVLKSGASADLAKKTLAAALTYAVAGDVVHVAEGTYSDGTMLRPTYYVKKSTSAAAPYIPSRAWVKEGVQLVADGARENTVILGASDPDTAEDAEKQGCGPNAVRCVQMDANTALRGFTIRGGRVDWENIEDDNNHGGGVLPKSNAFGTCLVEDCTIEDCRARRGGGARYGTFLRCRFIGNSCSMNGTAARQAHTIGCFFDGNTGPDVVSYPAKVVCCTFGPGNVKDDGAVAPPFGTMEGDSAHVVGSLFCTAGSLAKASAFVNCAFPANAATANGSVFTNCVSSTAADLSQIDANGVPIAGLNPACDGGDISQWTEYGLDAAKDAAGKARIANAAMDIGCYEADWKGRYSADICRRSAFDVTAADAYAHEEENGEVFLPSGEIAGTFNAAGRFTFPVRVTGNGTLTVTSGGVSTDYAGPLAAFQVQADAIAGSSLAFAYVPGENDAGGAFVGLGGRLVGTAFTIR